MRVKFNGMFREVSGGCVPCGQRKNVKLSFMSSINVILPSCISRVFHRNEPVEVSQLDGEWLMSWVEKDSSGAERHVFSEVE